MDRSSAVLGASAVSGLVEHGAGRAFAMSVHRFIGLIGIVVVVLFATASPAVSQPGAQAKVAPAEFGEVFPAGTFENFNHSAGGAPTIDLSRVVGKRPVVFYYWIAGNPFSDETFTELQALADEVGPTKLALYGVAVERPGLGEDRIQERIRALKIHVPVLNDDGFKIGQLLQVRHVPSISVLDAEGRLRLANAGSLKQPLEYKMEVETAIRRVATKGTLGTYGPMPRWYPVKELIGQPCPDFQAPVLGATEVRTWSDILDGDKITVLMFWSVDCPHCREALPELNEWLKANDTDGISFVGAARIDNEAIRVKTEEFCDAKGFVFPTLIDEGNHIGDQFRIVSTPTFVIVGPDGMIDSVLLRGDTDLGKKFQAKRNELLKDTTPSGT
jgi:thiol-disulfide isomerase/thioredoxin